MTPEKPIAIDRSSTLAGRSRDVVRKVLQLLAAVTARLRTPLLLIVLAPVIPAALLIILGATQGSGYLISALVCAVIAFIPAAWLFVRREQLTAAPQPPEDAAVELMAALQPTMLWDELRANLLTITKQRRRIGPLRQVWRGIRLSKDFKDHFTQIPRLRPFLPSRLRGLVFLVGACLASAVALLVLLVLFWLVSVVGLW